MSCPRDFKIARESCLRAEHRESNLESCLKQSIGCRLVTHDLPLNHLFFKLPDTPPLRTPMQTETGTRQNTWILTYTKQLGIYVMFHCFVLFCFVLFCFVLFCFVLFVFWDRVSLCSSGCPGTHSEDQAGLKLRNPPASAPQVLGLKVCATTACPAKGVNSWTPKMVWGMWLNARILPSLG